MDAVVSNPEVYQPQRRQGKPKRLKPQDLLLWGNDAQRVNQIPTEKHSSQQRYEAKVNLTSFNLLTRQGRTLYCSSQQATPEALKTLQVSMRQSYFRGTPQYTSTQSYLLAALVTFCPNCTTQIRSYANTTSLSPANAKLAIGIS